MLDSFKYTNHDGEIIEFGKGNIIIDSNSLRDYGWTYNNSYGNATGFKKKKPTVSITVLIYGDNAKSTADKMFEVFEKDVLANKRGKITVNDYYIFGYVYGSQKNSYLVDGILKLKLDIVIDSKYWTRESRFKFRPDDSQANTWLGYTYGYPYTYGRIKRNVDSLFNDSFVPQNAKIVIYGACVNPTVIIGSHYYSMNCTLAQDERLEINTSEKTIYKYTTSGIETNMFRYRGLQSYIFEKIPIGVNGIQTLPTGTNADIVILEERSEPKWVTAEEAKRKAEETSKQIGGSVKTQFNDEVLYMSIVDLDKLSFRLENEHLIAVYSE